MYVHHILQQTCSQVSEVQVQVKSQVSEVKSQVFIYAQTRVSISVLQCIDVFVMY